MGFQELASRATRFLKENRDWARAKHLQYEAFSRSRPQLEPRMRELCASYRPVVTQADLDAARHDYPEPTAALLQAEMSRISEHLEPITEGWPLDTKDRVLQRFMQTVWREMQGRLHVQVFGSLTLPHFYRLHHGFCSYEDTLKRTDQFGQIKHIGVQSGYNHGSVMPILWRHLT